MVPLQKLEVVLIAGAGLMVLFLAPLLPVGISLGRLIVEVSAVVLFQNFLREAFLLVGKSKDDIPGVPCLGLGGLMGGIGWVVGWFLFATGQSPLFHMGPLTWAMMVMVALFLGYLVRDLVVEKGRFSVHYEKGHTNVSLYF